jgi:hypothetical protein
MLIACKGADFIGHLQRFTSISLSVLPLYYLYITSTLPLHKLCRMSTNSSIVVFDTALKTIKLIRPPLLSCSDGTFRSFRCHLRVVPMALKGVFPAWEHFVSPKETLCFPQGNESKQAWERVETSVGTCRDKHGN